MPRRRTLIPLRWSDMDAYGHVNNVQYLRLFEDARIQAFTDAASEHGPDGATPGTGMLVARHEIEYVRPLVYRAEPVAIDVWITTVTGATFDVAYVVCEPDDVRLVYAQAASRMVVYDLASHRPRRMSVDERARLEPWQDPPLHFRHRPR